MSLSVVIKTKSYCSTTPGTLSGGSRGGVREAGDPAPLILGERRRNDKGWKAGWPSKIEPPPSLVLDSPLSSCGRPFAVVVVVVVVVVIVEHLVSKRLSGNASFDLHDSLIGPHHLMSWKQPGESKRLEIQTFFITWKPKNPVELKRSKTSSY